MSISYGQTPRTSMAEAICQLYTCMSVCLALPGHPLFFIHFSTAHYTMLSNISIQPLHSSRANI